MSTKWDSQPVQNTLLEEMTGVWQHESTGCRKIVHCITQKSTAGPVLTLWPKACSPVGKDAGLKVLKSATMLLVEDSPSDVRLIREALNDAPLRIRLVIAHDGVEAIDYLRRCRSATGLNPDLIILDLNLPRKSGHEVLAEVKSDPDLKSLSLIHI